MSLKATARGPIFRDAEVQRRVRHEFAAAQRQAAWLTRRAATRTVNRDRGIYDRGWQPPVTTYGGSHTIVTTVLQNTAPHAATLEGGRRAGARMPPVEAIRGWLQRRGGDPSRAWIVARNIGIRGIRAGNHVERALVTQAAAIARAYEQAVARIAKGLG